MQFLVTLTVDQLTKPLAELEFAMTALVEDKAKAGRFVFSGGLASHADGVRVELSPSGMPQAEARLPIHGFVVVEAPSLEDALEDASDILRLHHKYVRDWSGNCEIRPVVTHCLP